MDVLTFQSKLNHILVLEQDELYGFILRDMLREGSRQNMEIRLARTIEAGLEHLKEKLFDAILVDVNLLSAVDAEKTLASLQARDPGVPLLVLASETDEQRAIQSLQIGAQDYLIRGQFRASTLIRAIRHAQERQRLRTALSASLQAQLASSEARLQRIISENVDGIVLVGKHGSILFVNPAAEQLLGQAQVDLIGSWFGYPVSTSAPVEIEITRRHLPPAIAEMRAVDIQWLGDEALLVSLRDITERKAAEQALQSYAADLQARNEELDAFAHTVAHDLKNPLGVMYGFAETLQLTHQGLTEEKLTHYLQMISRNGRKAENIINELLLLASVRKEDIEPEPIEMGNILSEVEERLDVMLKQHAVELNTPPKLAPALGYAPWVEEVWVNYISNAIKYGGEPPRIYIGCDPLHDQMIRYWVQDNGPGLSREQQSRLFVPFTQLNQIQASGHGLGLSIVQRIVQKLGGQVGVDSQPGKGSLFYFTLPAAQ